jgi:hypothetical protein
MSSVYQVGCRLSRYHRLLQWFTYPPVGTIFTPADVLKNNILLSVCAFLNNNWNLWGGEEVRNLCMIADYIMDVYQQQEVIDLTLDEEPMMWSNGLSWTRSTNSQSQMVFQSQRSQEMSPILTQRVTILPQRVKILVLRCDLI